MKRIFLCFFVFLFIPCSFAQKVTKYEYWFDQNYGSKIMANVSPEQTFLFNQIVSTSGLTEGLHTFNIHFGDDSLKWSEVLSSYFIRDTRAVVTKTIVAYQYWFDSNYVNAISLSIAPQSQITLNTLLSTTSLSEGLHMLNIRFKDSQGEWTVVQSHPFVRNTLTAVTKTIVAYQYWFDSNYVNAISQSIAPQSQITLNTLLSTTALSEGIHVLNFRFKDSQGEWTVVQSHYFVRNTQAVVTKTITACQYWFDNDYGSAISQSITPQGQITLNTLLSTPTISDGHHVMNIRFKDSQGEWTVPQSHYFIRNTQIATTKTINRLEYWYDTAASNRISVNTIPGYQELTIDTSLFAQSISKGTHVLHTRISSNNRLWSSVTTDTFYKKGLFLLDSLLTPKCANDSLKIRFAKWATYNTGNVFTVQLSDSSGSFSTPIIIGSKANTSGGLDTITCLLPFSLKYSTHYKLRIVCSNIADTSSLSNEFTVNLAPAATITPSGPVNFCAGNSVTLNANIGAGLTHQWYNNSVIISGAVNPSYVATATGSYSVLVTNAGGCKKTANSINVTASPYPTPSISGSNIVCSGSTVTYNIASNTGRTYVWSVTGGTLSSGQGTATITVTWGAAGAGTLVVSDSINASGCKTVTSPYAVTINANPAPSITGLSAICENNSTGYSTSLASGRSYKWVITGGIISSGQNTNAINVMWGSSGTGTLTVMDSVNASGCKTVTAPYSVTINANPSPSITGLSAICENNSTGYSTSLVSGRSYKWVTTGGTISSGQNTNAINVMWGSSGIGTLTVMDSANATGCKTMTAPYSVTINSNPAPVVSGKNNVCSGTPGVYNTPLNTGRSYSWFVTKGVILSGAGTASVIVKWTTQGAGSIMVKDSNNATGCRTISAPLNVNINDTPVVAISGSSQNCELSTVIYNVSNNPGHTYNWSLINGTILSGQNTNSISASWLNGTSGMVSLKDSINLTGCVGSGSVSVNLLRIPDATFSGTQSQGKLTLTPLLTGLTYKWKFGDGDSSSLEKPTHTYAINGTYPVSLRIQGSNGCINDGVKSILINTVGLQKVLAGNFEMSAYPNPFRGSTSISFTLHESANINLDVFDLAGRLLNSFVRNEEYKAGRFEFTFDAEKLHTANSVYIVRLKVNDTVRFLRIVESDNN